MPQLMKKDPLTEKIASSLNPVQENILKTVQKVQKQQVEEAMMQGVPAEHILQQSGISFGGGGGGGTPNIELGQINVSKTPNALNMALVGPSPNQDQNSAMQPMTQDPTKRTLLGNILNTLGNITGINPMNEAVDSLRLQNADTRSGRRNADRESLIRNRNLESELMERQLGQTGIEKVYRDPITGQEVDPAVAEEDMRNGLGIYQVNQRMSTRGGVVEKPLNKLPDLTEGEKTYVHQARIINDSLGSLLGNYDALYEKGAADWGSLQAEKLPYYLTKDQDVQNFKSDLQFLKGQIPFLRGGKNLTKTESARVDNLLNPFGKSKKTFEKDISRFQDEFLGGAEIMKFGMNVGLMKKLIKGKSPASESSQPQDSMSDEKAFQEYLKMRGQ